jgi:hypothetical protein
MKMTDEEARAEEEEHLAERARDEAIKKDFGKTSKMDVSAVEEAVASQRRKAGDPFPYRSGFGKTGRRWADLEQYDAEAKRNGTSVPAALHDYTSVEHGWRTRGPATAIEFIAAKMNQDPLAVANHIVQYFSDPQKRAAAQQFVQEPWRRSKNTKTTTKTDT